MATNNQNQPPAWYPFPATARAVQSSTDDAARLFQQGQYARSLGAGLVRPVVSYPVAIADDVIGRPVRALAGLAADAFGGAVGSEGSTAVTRAAPAAPAAKPATARQAVDASLAKGRASAEPTPQQRALAVIDTILRGPVSLNTLKNVVGLLPAPTKTDTSAKGAVLGQTAQLSQQIYQNQVAQAQELAKTDPEGAQAVVAKATDDYFKRNAGLVGFNPADMVNAQILAAGLGGEQ